MAANHRQIRNTKPVTLADVARITGVSRCVAGQVLNGGAGNSRAAQQTVNRIVQVAKELDYRPNLAARQLRGKRSHTFGLLVASAGDPLRSFLVQYLDSEAVKIGCRTMIANTIGKVDLGPDQFEYHLEDFARRRVDGVFCAVHNWFGGDRAALLERHPNTVFYEDPGIENGSYVWVDRAQAVRLAVRHLLAKGRRRIGLALMSLSRPTHVDRLRGYQAELQAKGLPVDNSLVFNGEPFGLAYAHCNEHSGRWELTADVAGKIIESLVLEQQADALVAHDDFWAALLIRTLRRKGLSVPGDVAVVGYLNHYLADWTDPPLTTVDLQHQEAARTMVRMMEQKVQAKSVVSSPEIVRIDPKLVIRESA